MENEAAGRRNSIGPIPWQLFGYFLPGQKVPRRPQAAKHPCKKGETPMETDFPTRLRACRKKTGLNQEDAARQIGIAYSTYRRYEQGGTVPDLLTAIQLADFFNVSLDYLAGRTDQPTRF